MKELSIEEKAKAYDEAIKRAREYDFSLTGVCAGDVIEDIFPELKESEDEKIRGKLVEYFLHYPDHEITYYDLKADSVIAWLEKQGEETIPLKEIILNVWELGNYWKELTKGVCNTEYGRQLDYIVKHWKEGEHYIKSFEKKGEQKRTDKVEPKFHEGDWVVQGYNILKIKCVGDTHYCFETVGGYVDDMLVSEIDSQFHLWTIQDAKAGDVILDGSNPFIFKKTKYQSKHCYAFCGIGQDGNFAVNPYNWYGKEDSSEVWTWGSNLKPATKEQRNLLFQKMREAGYEWDAEKKELKKINSYCQENCKGFQETGKCFADGECKVKREAKQKSTEWSEEDEAYRRLLVDIMDVEHRDGIFSINPEDISIFKSDVVTVKRIKDWLKSLKDRVQPQNFTVTDEELAKAKKDAYNDALDKIEYHSGEPTFDDGWSAAIWYLKKRNAQPQNRWKPSKEQIDLLQAIINEPNNAASESCQIVLREVLEQLKKLKEE